MHNLFVRFYFYFLKLVFFVLHKYSGLTSVRTLHYRYEKRRAQEELEVVSAKTARLNTVHDGGPKVEQLQEQIKDLKDIVKCSVCHERRKEVPIYLYLHRVIFSVFHSTAEYSSYFGVQFIIMSTLCTSFFFFLLTWYFWAFYWQEILLWVQVIITKCFHLFCSPCIQRNLEHRHRKCPGCGTPFTQSDVRNVYI